MKGFCSGERRGGFTLIELLVALVILTLMLSAMGMIVVSTLDAERRLKASLMEQRVGSAIMELLARDIESVYSYGLRGALRGEDAGSADTLQLLSSREPASAVTDEEAGEETSSGVFGGMFGDEPQAATPRPEPLRLTKVTYFVQESRTHPGWLALLRAEEPFEPPVPEPGASGNAAPRVFGNRPQLDQAKVFEVYAKVGAFDVQFLDDEGNWLDGWRATDRLPAAIKVRLEIVPDPRTAKRREEAGREPTKSYELVVALPISIPPVERTGQSVPAGSVGVGGR